VQVPPKVINRRDRITVSGAVSLPCSSDSPAESGPACIRPDFHATGTGDSRKTIPAVKKPVAVDKKSSSLLPESVSADSVESLPVLGAMKQFIDGERRRFRRTLVGVTSVFIAIIALVIVATICTVRGMLAKTINQVRQDRDKIADMSGIVSRMDEALSQETDRISRRLTVNQIVLSNTVNIVDSLRLSVRDGMADLNQDSVIALSDMEMRFSRLTNRLAEIENENAVMSMELMTLKGSLKTSAQKSDSTISLYITSSNIERQVNWRLPVPSS